MTSVIAKQGLRIPNIKLPWKESYRSHVVWRLVKLALALRICSHTAVAWQSIILRFPIFTGSFCAGSHGLAHGSDVPQLEPQVAGFLGHAPLRKVGPSCCCLLGNFGRLCEASSSHVESN